MKTGITVCFPGTGFTCKEALFERLAADYKARGYDIVSFDFSHIPFREIESLAEAVLVTQRAVKRQLAGVTFSDYGDTVFLSKSLGTILAAQAEREYGVRARQLFMTPLNKTLSLICPGSRVIALVLGTQDRFLTGRALTAYCETHGYRCCLIEGVGHSLKDDADEQRTRRIIEEIAALCEG